MSVINGRLAPTPSGQLHAGNVFAFLVGTICARRAGGSVRLRIEDLDPARTKRKYAHELMETLSWLGFCWDDPVIWQSNRTSAYQQAFDKLERLGLVYPCFCSRGDLHAADAPHFGDDYVYPGTCRNLSSLERKERAQRRVPAWRVSVGNSQIAIDDAFQGNKVFNLEECSGDFIVRRSDGVFAYQLAVVIDDAAQNVTQVVRGIDLLNSAPRQRYLQDVLRLPEVSYAHIPILVDETGKRLAKRNHDASLTYLRYECGWTPERILGHIAYATHLTSDDEPCSLEQLVASANLASLIGQRTIAWKG